MIHSYEVSNCMNGLEKGKRKTTKMNGIVKGKVAYVAGKTLWSSLLSAKNEGMLSILLHKTYYRVFLEYPPLFIKMIFYQIDCQIDNYHFTFSEK
jgi:hypothetical protein